jgi:hypothetical protein
MTFLAYLVDDGLGISIFLPLDLSSDIDELAYQIDKLILVEVSKFLRMAKHQFFYAWVSKTYLGSVQPERGRSLQDYWPLHRRPRSSAGSD